MTSGGACTQTAPAAADTQLNWWLNWAPASSQNHWAILSWWFQQARGRGMNGYLFLVFPLPGKVDFIQMPLKHLDSILTLSLWALNCSVSFPNEWSQLAAHHVSEQQRFVRDQNCLCVLQNIPYESQNGRGEPSVLPLPVWCSCEVACPCICLVISAMCLQKL